MNKVPIAVIAVGIIITLAGIFVVLNIEEKARGTVDEGVLYVGANGEMEISGKSNPNEQGLGFYVHIKGTYKGGGEGGYNKERDNNTWDLTEDDCNLVRNFTLTHNNNSTQVFIPRCTYIEDDGGSAEDDDWIVVGTLCTQKMAGESNHTGDGCPDGTYTWNTGGVEVMVYDVDKLEEVWEQIILEAIASFGACCCGIVVLLIGIILAFTMEDPEAASRSSDWSPYMDTAEIPKSSSGWDEKEDYIHREKKDDEVPDESESEEAEDQVEAEETEEKNRSGEYEIPPPPET